MESEDSPVFPSRQVVRTPSRGEGAVVEQPAAPELARPTPEEEQAVSANVGEAYGMPGNVADDPSQDAREWIYDVTGDYEMKGLHDGRPHYRLRTSRILSVVSRKRGHLGSGGVSEVCRRSGATSEVAAPRKSLIASRAVA